MRAVSHRRLPACQRLEELRLRGGAADDRGVSRPLTIVLGAVLAAVLVGSVLHARQRVRIISDPRELLTQNVRDAGLTFSPAVAPADRQLILRDIALARPEARRLIDLVDGLVTVSVGDASGAGANAIGYTQ